MTSRAAPGPQLSTGRLRVDAARAIAKLREYQLVDRTAWILEAIRAAIAGGATKLSLRGDANDIWLAWEGPAWPTEELPRLFDELVSPEPTEERYHLRLLAAAVNSALGSDPAFVDIYSITSGEALRARYTPDVLAEPTGDLDDSPLRRIAATPAPVPAGMAPESGMLVHLRRRAALGMLAYLFWERDPPELATAAAACQDIAVPLSIGNRTLHRDRRDHDVLRVPLGDNLDGFVAVVDPRTQRAPHLEPTLELAERGVVLARYPIALPPPLGASGSELRGKVPLRVFLDAKRLPTNASRSQVRRDVPPISTAEERVPKLANQLIAELADAAVKPDVDDRTRNAAIAMIAAVVGGLEWANVTSVQLGPLAQLPLLRDATGVPRPIAYSWSGHVYTGSTPLSDELAPWLQGMLWVRRGDPAAAILAGIAVDAAETKRRIKLAKRMRTSHRRFFEKAPTPVALVHPVTPRIKVRIGALVPGSCVDPGVFAGLTGELALSPEQGAGGLLVLYQGRPIERISIRSPVLVDAVIDSQRLTPGEGYRSVERDAHYAVVELAARAAIVAAAEAIAMARWLGLALPDGFSAGEITDHDTDARIVRAALGLARELGFPIRGPLRVAAAWRTAAVSADGERWIAFDDIATERVIGFTSSTVRSELPAGRLMLAAGAQVLATLLPNTRTVDYDRGRVDGDVREKRAMRMAIKLASTHRFALAIDDGDLRGAIAPALERTFIKLWHTGRELDSWPYAQQLVSCVLAVDSDEIAPNREWTGTDDPGTAVSRSYLAWEQALVRAAARALAGDVPNELIGPVVSGLDNPLGTLLCNALAASSDALEPALLAKLKAAPLIHLLGERELVSIDELVRRFPTTIPVVDKLAAPVIGFTPVVGGELVGKALGRLVSIPITGGGPELELRRRTALRQGRLATHRRQPVLPLELAGGVPIDPAQFPAIRCTGLIAVNPQPRLEIAIRIENREFQTHSHSDELPMLAVLDLDPIHADATFEGLSELLVNRIVDGMRRSARPLLLALAAKDPTLLADPGPTRGLLVHWLAGNQGEREPLLQIKAFPTPYETRISLAEATQLTKTVWISRWQGDWLAAGDGEAPSPLDAGVIRVRPDGDDLEGVIRTLHTGPVHDVSDQVLKLQGQRRIARGLVPTPALPHVPVELKRKLTELGKHKLGPGEIGLVAGATSSVLIHVQGQPRERQSIDVLPAVHIAIEAPDLVTVNAGPGFALEGSDNILDQLARLRDETFDGVHEKTAAGSRTLSTAVQELIAPLVRDVITKQGIDSIPTHIRRSLRRAVLSRRLDLADPVFELADGSWVGIELVRQQITMFGSAWAVEKRTDLQPLDPARRVFLLAPDELGAARGHLLFVEAERELALDAAAAQNRQRPPAGSLDLTSPDDFLGIVELPGDGETSPRGQVGALLPHVASLRGLHAHRAMHPFDVVTDPCLWPTIAIIDDRRLAPDRTWAKARETADWDQVVRAVQVASADAIIAAIPKPPGALAFARTDEGVDVTQNAQLQIRGAAWILGAPVGPSIGIDVFETHGTRQYVPRSPLGIGGRLYVFATAVWDRDTLLEKLIGSLYSHLIKKLPPNTDKDLLAAHRANALALGYTMPFDVPPSVLFPGFRPEPVSATKLVALFRRRDAVRILPIAEIEADLHDPEAEGVVEDGSALSQVVIHHLARRAQRSAPAPNIERAPKPAPAAAVASTKSPPPSASRQAPHPIGNVVDHVRRRLVDLGVSMTTAVVARESPLLEFAHGELRFAGTSPRLLALANAMQAKSPWADDGAAALIAHAIAVMDAASKDINKQTQLRVLEALLT